MCALGVRDDALSIIFLHFYEGTFGRMAHFYEGTLGGMAQFYEGTLGGIAQFYEGTLGEDDLNLKRSLLFGELVKMDFPRVWHPFGGQTRGSCRALRGLYLSEW